MADIEKIRRRIRELEQRPKNITISEIEALVRQIGLAGYSVRARDFPHGRIFHVSGGRFTVCLHTGGSKQVKPHYVKEMIKVLIEAGIYGEE